MFCKNCNAPLGEDQRFCSQCGFPTEYQPKCRACGHVLAANARFCDNCGTPTSIADPTSNAYSQSTEYRSAQTASTTLDPALLDNKTKRRSFINICYVSLALSFIFLLILCFVPTTRLTLNSSSQSQIIKITFPFCSFDSESFLTAHLLNAIENTLPYTNFSSAFIPSLKILSIISSFLFDIIPIIIAIVLLLFALVDKNYSKIKRLRYHKIIAFFSMFRLLFSLMLSCIIASIYNNNNYGNPIKAGFTAIGWIMLFFQVALITLLFITSWQNKKQSR
ncbi:MAG: zinc ribbon domain-containing protein [Ruminococcaceae bacterium]|nr:zinc ribbon domain-containing protein [Oscillospiraceae bacterium]